VVGDGEGESGRVPSTVVGLVVGCDFVGSNIEGVASVESNVLVLGGVVDAVLSHELK
jgi:hypothetical protein